MSCIGFFFLLKGLLQDIVSKRDDCEPQDETQEDYNSWRPPEGPEFTPHCRWAPLTALDPQTFKFPSGAEVQLETVPPGLLPRIPVYFICTGCGKVFWEGTHYDRVLSQFQKVLHVSGNLATKAWDRPGEIPGVTNSCCCFAFFFFLFLFSPYLRFFKILFMVVFLFATLCHDNCAKASIKCFGRFHFVFCTVKQN